jgi:hypothetical protein
VQGLTEELAKAGVGENVEVVELAEGADREHGMWLRIIG